MRASCGACRNNELRVSCSVKKKRIGVRAIPHLKSEMWGTLVRAGLREEDWGSSYLALNANYAFRIGQPEFRSIYRKLEYAAQSYEERALRAHGNRSSIQKSVTGGRD